MRSPEPLTWRQVAPALPTAGHNARIVASEFSEKSKRHVFTHVCLDSSTPHRDSEAPAIFKGRWSKKFQYKREASCVTINSLRMKDEIVFFHAYEKHAVASVSLGRVY